MPRTPGISGLAVAVATAGGVMLYSGLRGLSVVDTLRSVVGQGQLPDAAAANDAALGSVVTALDSWAPSKAAETVGGAVGGVLGAVQGDAVVKAAEGHLGARYVFGAAGPDVFDCSGLVTYVLHHDLGVDLSAWKLPLVGHCNNLHTVTAEFYITTGLRTVPRDQCQAGDLVCWTGHIGIAVSNSRMIAAPHPGDVVKESNIWNSPPPLIRRMKGL